jgi:hypothetical protein
MDSWSEVMWWTMDGYQPIAGGIFFILLIILVSFNIVNLFIVVIHNGYSDTKAFQEKKRGAVKFIERSDEPELMRGEGWLVKTLNKFQLFVIIRKLVARTGELIFGVFSTVAISTEDPPLLNPLAALMKKIIMYPAQVCCDLYQHIILCINEIFTMRVHLTCSA